MLREGIYMLTGKQIGTIPFPETAQAARQVAVEGMVLLKNDGTLPFCGKKLALFGVGAIDTIVCGSGSGYAFSPYRVTVMEGLTRAGIEITSGGWLDEYRKAQKTASKEGKKLSIIDKRWSGLTPEAVESAITAEDLQSASAADTAVYVIRRNTGENFDRKAEKGDYYLSDREEENLRAVAAYFAHTIVVLNTCVIDTVRINEIPGVSALILMGQAGMESGNALADILTGKVNPSGRLTDTWAKRYEDYPAAKTFSTNDGITDHEDYNEDIFVGYRWFDSFGLDVEYPFGFGLSYTNFAMEPVAVTADWNQIRVTAKVRNTGKVSGREVVQVYVSAPAGRLTKPYQELKGYVKTGMIAPCDAAEVTICFATENLSSYDAEKAAWIMEPGDYLIRVGSHSRCTKVAAVLRLDGEAITRQVSNQLVPEKQRELVDAPVQEAETVDAPVIELSAMDCVTVDNVSRIPRETVTYVPEGSDFAIPERKYRFPFDLEERVQTVRFCPDATLPDVKSGKVTMEEFVASLDTETLLRIVTGTGKETKHPVPSRAGSKKYSNTIALAASGKTTAQYTKTLGIPALAMCDGPAGLHLMGNNCTAFPVGMVLAQTWDVNAAARIGDNYGMELEKYRVHIALGPGMNIHRDPLCGRNFEYYSEDPLLTGKTAASFTKGMQENHPGHGVALKHFACNNQEIDRITSTSNVSERALREIYLKGFEICVREAKPMTVMSSYNCINGIHTSSRYDLLTDVLRGEWGFEGFVMTDWDSQSEKPYDFHAGNDIIMGGYSTDIIAAAISGAAPVFDADGAVHQTVVTAYGGFFKNTQEDWNSFVPDKDGADTVSTTVAAGKKLSPRVEEAVKVGIAQVTDQSDGSKLVTYRGIDRGAWLPLGDIQKCAIRVLTGIMNAAPMDDMLNGK